MTVQSETTAPTRATPEQLGVGMRLSVHPHCDDFAEVILGALADVADAGLTDELTVKTDEVSTFVGARATPAEQRLAAYATGLIDAASRRSDNGHVVAHLLFSRGCPGAVTCDLSVTALPESPPVLLEPTGLAAAAQWSLYPMVPADATDGDHMARIEAAVTEAHQRGIASAPEHFATKLTGDLAEVMATAVDAWGRVGAVVPHVVTHLTVSVGSPTEVDR